MWEEADNPRDSLQGSPLHRSGRRGCTPGSLRSPPDNWSRSRRRRWCTCRRGCRPVHSPPDTTSRTPRPAARTRRRGRRLAHSPERSCARLRRPCTRRRHLRRTSVSRGSRRMCRTTRHPASRSAGHRHTTAPGRNRWGTPANLRLPRARSGGLRRRRMRGSPLRTFRCSRQRSDRMCHLGCTPAPLPRRSTRTRRHGSGSSSPEHHRRRARHIDGGPWPTYSPGTCSLGTCSRRCIRRSRRTPVPGHRDTRRSTAPHSWSRGPESGRTRPWRC